MQLTSLFKKSSTGALLEWTIEVKGNKYRTHSGQRQFLKWFEEEK